MILENKKNEIRPPFLGRKSMKITAINKRLNGNPNLLGLCYNLLGI
jgi:hypothetical protein